MSQSGTFFSGISPAGPILTLTADTGGPVPPTAGNIDIVGSTNINTAGNPGASTIEINLDDDVVISGSFTAGTTSGFIKTVTGDVIIEAGNLDLPATLSTGDEGVITISGVPFIQNYGVSNTFLGPNAGNFTLTFGTAVQNTAVGDDALNSITTGHNNTCVGYNSMFSNSSGSLNTAMGSTSLPATITGSGNTCFGAASGGNYASSESNNICLGSPGVVSDANTIRIGVQGSGSLQQNECFIAGIVGNTVANTELVTINSATGQLGVTATGGLVTTFATDSGNATPSGGTITMHGGSNLNTSGAGSTVTYNLDNTVSISGSMTAGTGFTATIDNVNILDGNLALPVSDVGGSAGVITSGGIAYIQNAGDVGSVYICTGAGATALADGSAPVNNIGIGNNALNSIHTSGTGNVGIGIFALQSVDSSFGNVAIGSVALTSLTGPAANFNVAIGDGALNSLGTGGSNLALGSDAGELYSGSESNNICLLNNGVNGESSVIRIGTQGSGVGQQNKCFIAGIVGVTASSPELVTINSSTGQLGVTSTGGLVTTFNAGTGSATPSAGAITMAGGSNLNTTATGSTVTFNLNNTVSVSGSITAATGLTATAGGITATGTSNINTTGSAVTTIGTGGTGNVAIGNATGNTTVTGSLTASTSLTATAGNITATSGNLLLPTTTSTVGQLQINATSFLHSFGTANAFVGSGAGNFTLTTGSAINNTALGGSAMAALTTGASNVCVGFNSGNAITTSADNVFIGASSGSLHSTGTSGIGKNVAVGWHAGLSFTTGEGNVLLGSQAGSNYTGAESSNILIGAATLGTVSENNVLRIGAQGTGFGQQNLCFISGITGATVTGSAVLCSSVGQLGTIASSIRYKENIQDISNKSNDILSLRPVTFNYKKDETKRIEYGLIAEEVEEIFPSLVLYDQEGTVESVAYHQLPVLLLNELKKALKRIEELERKIDGYQL